MAKVPKDELEGFQRVMQKVIALIQHSEEVLLEGAVEAPSHSEFQRNPDATYKWILDTQQIYTRMANSLTRLKIEDRRLWELGEELKKSFGVVETEDLCRQVNHHLKSLRDIASMFRETKNDLNQIITSVRSVQSSVTNRFKATGGN
jgi:hypothetical protein